MLAYVNNERVTDSDAMRAPVPIIKVRRELHAKPRVTWTLTYCNRRPRRRLTRNREFSWHGSIRRDATFFTPARETRTSSFLNIIAEAHAPRDVCRRSQTTVKAVIFERVEACIFLKCLKRIL